MDAHSQHDADALAERTTRLIAHLDGALSPSMLDAMTGVWSTLERAAADDSAHARAVRARLFWESLTPGGLVTPPSEGVFDLVASWDEDDDSYGGFADEAEAA
jgi:hypothetical protein